MWFFGGVALAYLGYRMQDRVPSSGSPEEKKRLRIAYPMLGGTIGLATGFFGPVILTVISVNSGGHNFIRNASATDFISIMITSTVIGALLGYYIGKRNNFRKPQWISQMDERLGF